MKSVISCSFVSAYSIDLMHLLCHSSNRDPLMCVCEVMSSYVYAANVICIMCQGHMV